MPSYKELLAQKALLDAKIAEAKQSEDASAIRMVRDLVAEFGLTAEDVFGGKGRTSASKGSKVAAKYRDPATGSTWTGRGKAPKWIAGKNRDDFAV